jgi:hypothetical protein
MKKVVILCIIVCSTSALSAQDDVRKWEFGTRAYTIFTRTLSGTWVVDFKGDLGFGIDLFSSRRIIKDKLLLNMGVNFENYSYRYINSTTFKTNKFLVLRTDFGIEYKFIAINKFSSSLLVGTSLLQAYLNLDAHDYDKEKIKESERKNIYPYAMLKFNYHFKDKVNIGLFIKTNFYPYAYEEQDTRFSSGVEFKF